MFVIVVYDVADNRVQKVHDICRRYLTWVQLSVFEGELSDGQLKQLKNELKRAIKPAKDSIIFYTIRTSKYFDKEVMGVSKGEFENLII